MANFRRKRPVKHPSCYMCQGFKRCGNSKAKGAYWSSHPQNRQPTRSERVQKAMGDADNR